MTNEQIGGVFLATTLIPSTRKPGKRKRYNAPVTIRRLALAPTPPTPEVTEGQIEEACATGSPDAWQVIVENFPSAASYERKRMRAVLTAFAKRGGGGRVMTRQERLEKRIRAEWRPLLEKMQAVAQEHGMQIEERNPCAPEYQICRMTCDGVRLVVYPPQGQHRKSARPCSVGEFQQRCESRRDDEASWSVGK